MVNIWEKTKSDAIKASYTVRDMEKKAADDKLKATLDNIEKGGLDSYAKSFCVHQAKVTWSNEMDRIDKDNQKRLGVIWDWYNGKLRGEDDGRDEPFAQPKSRGYEKVFNESKPAPKVDVNIKFDTVTEVLIELKESTDRKAKYRELVRKWHPDVNPDPQATEVLKQLNELYSKLK